MAATPTERLLRISMLCAAVPSFIILLVCGIVSDSIISYVSSVPLTTTLVTTLVYLYVYPKDKPHSARKPTWIFVDLCTFPLYLGPLIAFWVVEPNRIGGRWYYSSGNPEALVAETYGTCLLLVNMFIHLFLSIYHARNYIRLRRSAQCSLECPSCGEKIVCKRRPDMTKKIGKSAVYSLLGDYAEDDEEIGGPSRPNLDAPSERSETEEV